MAKPLTIIMVGRKQLNSTKRALESLAEFTDSADYRLIFFDSGSDTPEEMAFVPAFCREHGIEHLYLYSKENVGWITAINHCYTLVDTEYSLTVHNDVKFSKYWLRHMVRKFDDKKVAAVGPVITFAMGPQSIHYYRQTLGCKVKYILGLFFLARQTILNEIKKEFNNDEFWLNPVYGLGDKEELEFCYLIREAGYKFAIARDVIIEHEGEKAFVATLGSQKDFHEYQTKKLELLKSRLGDDVVEDIYKVELEGRMPKVRIGVLTRISYNHVFFTFSFAGTYAATVWHRDVRHVPRAHADLDRNFIVEEMLKDESISHLCFIDDDMTFDADVLNKLMLMEVDIATGIAFQRRKPYHICIFGADMEKKQLHPTEAIKVGTVPISASGCYFLLVKREVFEKVEKPWFKFGDTSTGFNVKEKNERYGEGIGEDVGFCVKAMLAGFKQYCDTEITIHHIGDEEDVDEKQYYKSKENNFYRDEEKITEKIFS